jgi:hypothetical protein
MQLKVITVEPAKECSEEEKAYCRIIENIANELYEKELRPKIIYADPILPKLEK